MEALITRTDGLMFVILLMVAFSLWLQRYKVFKSLGPVGCCIWYYSFQYTYRSNFARCIQHVVDLLRTAVDFDLYAEYEPYRIEKLIKEPVLALISAISSVCLVAIVLGIFFAPRIVEGWKCAGMFVGTYTGGTPNLTAIATGLDCSRETLAAANAADYVVSTPLMVFLFAAPMLMKASKKWNKLWPYQFSKEELEEGDKEPLMSDKKWSIRDIA